MVTPVVVDTDLLIDFLRGRGEGAGVVRSLLRDGLLRFAAVTAFEVRVGVAFADEAPAVERLLRSRTLPLDLAAALEAGRVAADLRARGEPIGTPDVLIAGTALRHGLPVATRNVRHFGRVAGLGIHEAS